MQSQIHIISEKKLVGRRMKMSLTCDKTGELWRSFMPIRKEINNMLTSELISLQVYKPFYFVNFNPDNEFEKWATVEVASFDDVPNGMETFTLKGGQYAIFTHRGSSADHSTFQYIFSTWLPNSDYVLDDRPHFEILGEKYKNMDADSEEQIWIPIKSKP